MKKFLVKITFFLLVVGMITICINQYYLSVLLETGEEAKFQMVPDNIKICNFGSSHGVHGYYYKDLEDKYICFNFALDSQSLSYDERILDYYQGHLADGSVVIIDISYFACYGHSETEADDFEAKNKRYYKFLPAKLIKDYDLYTDLMVNRLRALGDGPLNVVAAILNGGGKYNSVKSYSDIWNTVDVSKLGQDTAAAAERHVGSGARDNQGKLIYNKEEVTALENMVDICRKHNATPIFVTVPYLKEYKDAISIADEDFFAEFEEWIENESEKLGVMYYDYSDDQRFCTDYALFYNGDHMNSIGARKFTDILYNEVIVNVIK